MRVGRIRSGGAAHADWNSAGGDGGGDVGVAVAVIIFDVAAADVVRLVAEVCRDDRMRQLYSEHSLDSKRRSPRGRIGFRPAGDDPDLIPAGQMKIEQLLADFLRDRAVIEIFVQSVPEIVELCLLRRRECVEIFRP